MEVMRNYMSKEGPINPKSANGYIEGSQGSDQTIHSYERLEFIGDLLLEYFVSEQLNKDV